MNIRDLLEAEMNKLCRLNPEVHALLEKIFQYKDGKGDYSVDRHKRPMPSIDMIVKRIKETRKIQQED